MGERSPRLRLMILNSPKEVVSKESLQAAAKLPEDLTENVENGPSPFVAG
jgi:hypothetical protein